MNELERQIDDFLTTGELRMSLVLNANSAVNYLQSLAEGRNGHFRKDYADAFRKNAAVYREVAAQFGQVNDAARLTEIAVWFGRPDRADAETVEASRQFSQQWLPTRPGEPEPDFGLTTWPGALQLYYREAVTTGNSFTTPDFKAMLMGSAGRVLLTVRDSRASGHPDAKFDGANITLIFDEDAKHPRGGIQSLCGTKSECLGLLKALRDSYPMNFKPDREVSFG